MSSFYREPPIVTEARSMNGDRLVPIYREEVQTF